MIPKRIALENFLSHGCPGCDLRFADDEPLWVLCGPNGVGKSAVFDAITYALFGCHRGGKKDAEQLIRHGADGFKVIFEFEFAGVDYRVTRTRFGRTTQKVERRDPASGDWHPVVNVNSAPEVQAWSEDLLGLGFDQFTKSVLLRQGEADLILTAGGPERLALLKKIIGVEQFEGLSERVHDATKRCKNRLGDLQTQKDGLVAVSAQELAEAADKLEKAISARDQAHEKAQLAVERVGHAKRWVKLDRERGRLTDQIRHADNRAAGALQIRTDKTRLDDLTAVAPLLRQAVEVRDRLARAMEGLKKKGDELTVLTAERDRLAAAIEQERQKADEHKRAAETHASSAKRLREEIDRETKFVAAVASVTTLRTELEQFPTDLAEQLGAAEASVRTATGAEMAAGNAKAEAGGLLKQAQAQQKKFATVGVGVSCSLCGQPVTAAHAERERQRIAGDIDKHSATVAAADIEERATQTAKDTAENERNRLFGLSQQHATATTLLRQQTRTLAEFGMTADADALRTALREKAVDAESLESAAATAESARASAEKEAARLAGDHKSAAAQVTAAENAIHKTELAVSADEATAASLVGQLPADWQSKLDTLDAHTIQSLEDERRTLAESGVAEQFRQLESDAIQRAEWAKQLGSTESEIAEIPAEARIAVVEAERACQKAKLDAGAADKARNEMVAVFAALERQNQDYKNLTADIAGAERQADLHRKLDDLLGKTGLQRELVRTAESEIVHLANDTAQRLSDGDLSIELDAAEDGEDKAFTLRIRRAENPTPIGVAFLSGSQKFRVAVAVALAIGRYAAGQARRLESVIIDEGFGSLDAEGLRAMADELNQLQRTQSLKRIVLVSHQEEFASRFPVGYRLTPGENGPTATAFRQ